MKPRYTIKQKSDPKENYVIVQDNYHSSNIVLNLPVHKDDKHFLISENTVCVFHIKPKP